ncbi:glutamate racemase, partial [Streptomyces sp. Isolate_219]|nr:glutamate racemase [Streptomyces sp. Isolate_219]
PAAAPTGALSVILSGRPAGLPAEALAYAEGRLLARSRTDLAPGAAVPAAPAADGATAAARR